MAEVKKKGLNTNSNGYTLIYSTILVVVVAFLLAFVFKALKPQQDINVALDKKKQLLYALNIRDISDEEAAQKYKEVVLADEIIDTKETLPPKANKAARRPVSCSTAPITRLAAWLCSFVR